MLHLYLRSQREAGNAGEARDFIRDLRRNHAYKFKKDKRAELARWEAELSMILDDPVGALCAYRDALYLDEENFELWNDFALVKKRLGRFDHADQAFARAAEINPQHFAPLINRLELAIEMEDFSLARDLVKQLETMSIPPQAQERLEEISNKINQEN